MTTRFRLLLLVLLLALCPACAASSSSTPGAIQGRYLPQGARPERVVSLYPTASEILSALLLGDQDATAKVVGVTWHDANLPGLERAALVGGFAWPDVDRILALRPDMVILAPFQEKAAERLKREGIPTLALDTKCLADGVANIRLLGRLMGREREAEAIIAGQEAQLQLAADKLARASESKPGRAPLRVVRFMGFSGQAMLTPGDDSFQNELIVKAGGQPPRFNENGPAIRVTPEQWRAFSPEAVYYCGPEAGSTSVREALSAPAWAEVPAIRENRLFEFPCDLICRAGVHYGDFALWLASELNAEAFARPQNQAAPDQILSTRSLDLPFAYLASAGVSESRLFDFTAKTLLLRFKAPQRVLSSLTGWADNITAVGNHYTAPPSWPVTHRLGFERTNARALKLFGLSAASTAFLYTGADMDHLAYAEAESDGLRAGVLATAGVKGNAMRASADSGDYVEPGTINLIILTNRALTPGAMSRALITATEAKTAALEDLDIRSSYSGLPATGTGTDNILVASGAGPAADLTGGHARLGGLIARATRQAVLEAIQKQNRLGPERDIFQRLAERRIPLGRLLRQYRALEGLLLDPRNASFVAAGLALADARERGLLSDSTGFSAWCLAVASETAGRPVKAITPWIDDETIPEPLRQALNALLEGAAGK